MIRIENTVVSGMEAAIRGMRNAKNSWDKADSKSGYASEDFLSELIDRHVCDLMAHMDTANEIATADCYETLAQFYHENAVLNKDSETGIVNYFLMGGKDFDLATNLSKAGTDHGKYLRQIQISVDITAPLFWWKEFDTYKVGTVANSTSTMHTITNSPITLENFSFEVLFPGPQAQEAMCDMITIVQICEQLRRKYLKAKEDGDDRLATNYWRLLIELLPNGWLQKRTVTLNYAVAKNIYNARHAHKLTEWHKVCKWISELPYAQELILNK
jgi:hypothetical protein